MHPAVAPRRRSEGTGDAMTAVDLTLVGAFLGGLISFLSPCVLPVIPAYVSVVTGLSATSVLEGGRSHLGRVLKTSFGFVLGFSSVFVLLGLSVTVVGSALLGHRGSSPGSRASSCSRWRCSCWPR